MPQVPSWQDTSCYERSACEYSEHVQLAVPLFLQVLLLLLLLLLLQAVLVLPGSDQAEDG